MEVHKPAAGHKDAKDAKKQGNEGDTGDLERVRDILFGSQVRQLEQQLQALADDVKSKLESARQDLKKQSDDLQAKLVERADALTTKLDEEKKQRTKALSEAVEKTQKSVDALDKRFTELTDHMEDEKAGRRELSRLFRHVASELGEEEKPANKKKGAPAVSRELNFEGAP